MRFSNHLSDAHREYEELNKQTQAKAKALAYADGPEAVTLAEEILEIKRRQADLAPLLETFPCNSCERETPVREKAEVSISGGAVSRGEQPAIFLDGRFGPGKIGIRLCHSCAIELGLFDGEELTKNLIVSPLIVEEGPVELDSNGHPKNSLESRAAVIESPSDDSPQETVTVPLTPTSGRRQLPDTDTGRVIIKRRS
jgi:hypothetical protein